MFRSFNNLAAAIRYDLFLATAMESSNLEEVCPTVGPNLPLLPRNTRSASEVIITTTTTSTSDLSPASNGNNINNKRNMQTRSASSGALIVLPPPAKRQRSSEIHEGADTPIASPSLPSTPAAHPAGSAKQARELFFDSLVADKSNSAAGLVGRNISSADSLNKEELMRCFYLLHACGRATQADATLETTRKSIEGFLDAIFNSWFANGDDEVECGITKPILKLQVEVSTPAGIVCGKFVCLVNNPRQKARHISHNLFPERRDEHDSFLDCNTSNDCNAIIIARATYTIDPPSIKLEFAKHDISDNVFTAVSPIGQQNTRWRPYNEWLADLRDDLEKKAIVQVHKYNKHLAIWKARVMVRAWAKNEDVKGGCSGDWGFVTIKDVRMALMIMG